MQKGSVNDHTGNAVWEDLMISPSGHFVFLTVLDILILVGYTLSALGKKKVVPIIINDPPYTAPVNL